MANSRLKAQQCRIDPQAQCLHSQSCLLQAHCLQINFHTIFINCSLIWPMFCCTSEFDVARVPGPGSGLLQICQCQHNFRFQNIFIYPSGQTTSLTGHSSFIKTKIGIGARNRKVVYMFITYLISDNFYFIFLNCIFYFFHREKRIARKSSDNKRGITFLVVPIIPPTILS